MRGRNRSAYPLDWHRGVEPNVCVLCEGDACVVGYMVSVNSYATHYEKLQKAV
jgi:hypothetical protein